VCVFRPRLCFSARFEHSWLIALFAGAKASAKQAAAVACVYCRAPWTGPGAATPAPTPTPAGASRTGARAGTGYLNLADVAGLDARRDTSSCEWSVVQGRRGPFVC
jgi:hypothetical protein